MQLYGKAERYHTFYGAVIIRGPPIPIDGDLKGKVYGEGTKLGRQAHGMDTLGEIKL